MFKYKLLKISILFFTLSIVHFDSSAADGEDRSSVPMLVLVAGDIGIDPDDNLENPSIFEVNYRMLPFSKWDLIPAIGLLYKDGGAGYVYFDIRYDYWLSDDWVLVPGYGFGAFHRDYELDLGGSLEFRAGVEISHRFDNDYRLGLAIFHLSNGRVYSTNPGTEAIGLSLSIPLQKKIKGTKIKGTEGLNF